MKRRNKLLNKILTVFLSVVIILSCLPIIAMADTENINFTRFVDANTMDNWKRYFDLDNLDTSNAGGVWADKSVFTDASEFPSSVKMIDDGKNFLTALSAIAANKEVVGYSTVPTDTVLILDLSNSMPSSARTQLITAANNAIKKLQEVNNNNRVGVVLYSGDTNPRTYGNAVTRLMPIDRYTTTRSDGNFIRFNNGTVSVYSGVSGSKSGVNFGSKAYEGATYIQAGLWEAYKMFNEIPDSDIVIGSNNWQSGESRMPIVVLMSDGAPTLGASKFDDVENQTYGNYNTKGADVGDGNSSGTRVGQGFLVQLTASYIKNRIENKYKVTEENGAGRSLFYTLGFNLSTINDATAKSVAASVLNPDGSTITDSLWATYNNATTRTMQVQVEGRNGGSSYVTVTKSSYATSKSYVDEYFSASNDGLTQAFDDIVEEIILQSRYYPTHLEGGSPDFSGYVEFTDTIGEYMEIKHINGILLGDTLFDGHMMASKLADTTSNGLGTPENPTALGDEFIRSVKTRLGISNTADAHALVAKAYNDGQLKYKDENDWSNYIAWYADENNAYLGFYDEDGTEQVPTDAVYINRSYGFLGETSGSIKNSDMMYMSVQVKTNIQTGKQTLTWKIPASLVPMITYLVTLKGSRVETATEVSISVEDKDKISPIRLIFETGLRSDLNEFNITRITGNSITDTKKSDERHIDTDGHTRLFWNNSYDISAPTHDEHKTALAEFTPSKENERFYFTFDSAVHKKTDNGYVIVGENETLDENGEYYHRRYIFDNDAQDKKPVFFYEKISEASIKAAKDNGWQKDFVTLDNTKGAWVIPKGTPTRELKMYAETKRKNNSNSANMVFHPYVTEHNNFRYIDMNLGNNGLLKVTPATGIKITKTIDIFETGTSDTFKFRINASASGSFDSWITAINETPSGEPTTATFVNGVYEFEMRKDQTIWISGIPAGTTYTVEEISDNADYKIKSVHVNGTSTGKTAIGTVAQYLMDDVLFVNTAIGEGDLVITKQVVDANGNTVDVNDNVKFTAEITLTDSSNNALIGTFTSSAGNITLQNGKYTVSLSDGESFVIRGIPEETKYTVVEKNIPTGFALNNEKSNLEGVVDATANDQALIVNTYNPVGTNGQNIDVKVTKEISGNRQNWLNGETYTFNLERLDLARTSGTVIDTVNIGSNDIDKAHLFSLSSENYAAPGTYYYRITEVEGTQGGITYDTAERRFSVVVADKDMDGDLEIISVNNEMNTLISGNWLVTADFNNVYAPSGAATAAVSIKKNISGNHALSGYQFALYDADPSLNAGANEIVKSGLTDAAGNAKITLSYSAADVGETFTYYLAEINRGLVINNIKYSNVVYKVEVEVKDNLDGTISAVTVIHGLQQNATVPTFTNEYVPSASDFITISGKKNIIGERTLNANEFEFAIEAITSGAPMPDIKTVKNAADGSFFFDAIEFGDAHKSNTYQYRIVEKDTNKIGGFDYDGTVYTVTVTVADNGDQTITATAVINNGSANVDNIVFNNTYDAKDAEVVLEGTKILTGKTLQNGEFEFVLKAVTNGAPMPSQAIAKNNAKGEIAFSKITYNKAGTYVYELTEKNGSNNNYHYDNSVYTVTVTVTDNSQGVLSASVALSKDDMPSNEIVFRNSFTPAPISYNIHTDFGGEKDLSGRTLIADEFEFALINAINGQQIGETVKNAADGKFNFPAVSLNTAGIYHFKIVELVGDKKGVTYDASSFHIRLEVVQNDNGVLSIIDKQLHKGTVSKQEVGGVLTEVTTYENITDNGEIVFNNIYKADPVYLIIEATKSLVGRDLSEEEFSFELYDDTNTKLETVKNDKDGKIAFAPISVDKEGEYVYTVREYKGDAKNVTYDASVYTVKAVVTDNLDGTFSIEYSYLKGNETETAITFINVYEAPAPKPTPDKNSPITGDSFNINLWFALLFVSSGGLITTAIYSKKKSKA